MGALLFLVFINDLPSSISHSIVDIYADDMTLCCSAHFSTGLMQVQTNLQNDKDKLFNWSDENYMVLNASKTKSILLIGQRLQSRLQNSTLVLCASGVPIQQVSSQKLLGVIIDEKLTFNEHVDYLCKKPSQKIGLLKKMRPSLPIRERKLFYKVVIKVQLMYGGVV